MKITPIQTKVSDLIKNYSDDGDGGVFGYDNRFAIRLAYQREFVYKDKQKTQLSTVLEDEYINTHNKTGKI